MTSYRAIKRGFTLVEILIVVIILGILAAIVIPQFTNASTEARQNSVRSQLQTLRSQIELYKLQHNDDLPDLVTNWTQLTTVTDATGVAPSAGEQSFGPYMQAAPVNSLNNSIVVVNGDGSAAAASACGFVYDYAAAAGTGKIFATDTNGTAIFVE
jgi:general secretion pathway protein G